MKYLFVLIILLSSTLPSFAIKKKLKNLETDQKGPIEILDTFEMEDSSLKSIKYDNCLSKIIPCLDNCPQDVFISRKEDSCECTCSESKEGTNTNIGLDVETLPDENSIK